MSDGLDVPVLERPAFFDGQRLTAADLSAVQTFHRELRRLHNRSLHNWGIAFGYAVSGARGERVVLVQGGYALDCKGRELISSEPLTLPVPAVAGASGGGPATYYLTASYAEDQDLPASETRTGVCQGTGAVRRPEKPRIRWQDPDDSSAESGYRRGLDVILASVQVQNCQLAADISASERRNAIPAQQPYVAAGQTKAGETVWRLWPDAENAVAVATTVPTSSAGFRSTPRYQAHVVGERAFEMRPDKVPEEEPSEEDDPGGGGNNPSGGEGIPTVESVDFDEAMLGQYANRAVVDGYVQIAQPAASTFELIVVLPVGILLSGAGFAWLNPPGMLTEDFMGRLQTELKWHVVWMGIEG